MTEVGKPFRADDGYLYVFVRGQEQCSGCRRRYSGSKLDNMKQGCDTCYGRTT